MLSLLSYIYKGIIRLRNLLYDYAFLPIYSSKLPVICVGNLTAGGSGKTPLVIYLAKLLKKQGIRPVILSRGYGGKLKGPYLIQDIDSPENVGDEPLLIQKKLNLPVVISRIRSLGAKLIESQNLGDLIIMDDGFQHRALARDLNILSIDISSEKAAHVFLCGDLLPVGRLREEIASGLKRTNLVVYNQKSSQEAQQLAEFKKLIPDNIPQFISKISDSRLTNLHTGEERAAPCKVVAFCGIANSESFFETLERKGYQLMKKVSFKDHAQFNENKINELGSEFPLVCTEKDAIKLKNISNQNIYQLSIDLEVENSTDLVRIVAEVAKKQA